LVIALLKVSKKAYFIHRAHGIEHSTNLAENAAKKLAIPHKNNMVGNFDFKHL